MHEAYQLTFDDIQKVEKMQSVDEMIAFFDECGNFRFDFSKEGTSQFFTICGILIKKSNLETLNKVFAQIKDNNGFRNSEMKSSNIGKNYRRRNKIINEVKQMQFSIVALITDKTQIYEDSPLRSSKSVFLKFLHQRLYEELYTSCPKLKIAEDATGGKDFQDSFKNYVREHRHQPNLFNDFDFEFFDSKNEALIQLADLIAGSINLTLTDKNAPNYKDFLKEKIVAFNEFPCKKVPYWGKVSPEECEYDSNIYTLSVKCAEDFIAKNKNSQSEDKQLQIAFLNYLLFIVNNTDPSKYTYSTKIISVLQQRATFKISRNYLYRKIIASLRDENVLIASCSNGYKIPISIKDIKTYLNQSHAIVSPMLHRMGICRKLIKVNSGNLLDVLDDPAFQKYKLFFDN